MTLGKCAYCGDPLEGHGYSDSCQKPEKKFERAKAALEMIAAGHGCPSALAEDTLKSFYK